MIYKCYLDLTKLRKHISRWRTYQDELRKMLKGFQKFKHAGNDRSRRPTQGLKRAFEIFKGQLLWNFSIIIQCQTMPKGVPLRLENTFFWTWNIIEPQKISNKASSANKIKMRLSKFSKRSPQAKYFFKFKRVSLWP